LQAIAAMIKDKSTQTNYGENWKGGHQGARSSSVTISPLQRNSNTNTGWSSNSINPNSIYDAKRLEIYSGNWYGIGARQDQTSGMIEFNH